MYELKTKEIIYISFFFAFYIFILDFKSRILNQSESISIKRESKSSLNSVLVSFLGGRVSLKWAGRSDSLFFSLFSFLGGFKM